MLAKVINRFKRPAEGDRDVTPAVLPLGEDGASRARVHSALPSRAGERLEWVIASVCISAGVVGLRTVNDPRLWSEWFGRGELHGPAIGRLVKKSGGVRFRSSSSPLWHDLYSGSEAVSAGDTVFTSDDGQAELILDDGSRAQVEPNSLIVVQRSDEIVPERQKGWLKSALGNFFAVSKRESVLKIEKGSARFELRKNASPVKLQVRGKVYELASGDESGAAEVSVESRSDGTGAQVKFASVSGGALELAEAGKEGVGAVKVQVQQGHEAILKDGAAGGAVGVAVQQSLLAPSYPAPGERLLVTAGTPLLFAWRWQGASGADAAATLELEGPESKSIAVMAASQALRVQGLSEGAYRWRLSVAPVSGVGERLETAWRSFSWASLASPRPLGPLGGTWIALPKGKGTADVVFGWSELPRGVEAEVSWRKVGDKVGGPPLSAVTAANGISQKLEAGDYEWKVRARTADGAQRSSWSEPLNFGVRAEGDLASQSRLQSLVVDGQPVAADGRGTAEAVGIDPAAAGKASTEPKSLTKKQTPPRPVRVLALSSTSGSTKLGRSDRLDQLVVPLEWRALADATSYEVSVTDAVTGKRVLKQSSPSNWLNWVLKSLDSTRFTYQVTAVTASGERIASAPVPIEIKMSAPVLKTPPDATRVDPSQQGIVLLTWERTVLTDSYRVEIAADPEFRKRVRTETTLRNLLSLRGLVPGRIYYWRVQSITKGKPSFWSAASRFWIGQ